MPGAPASTSRTAVPRSRAWGGELPSIRLGNLASTLERLAQAGARDFYKGDIASALVADARSCGVRLNARDLRDYRAQVGRADSFEYRGATVHAATGLSAGPTLRHALSLLAPRLDGVERPDARACLAYADALCEAWRHRLERLGEDTEAGRGCTTHLSVVDGEGNMVALTQTLLSLFGSKVTFPRTGILMNNGIMWFDPRPGRPNSIVPGRRPLSNMCPVVAERVDGFRTAMGASGGRRILPAVFQLLSFMLDFRMSVEEAVHHPRLDASGEPVLDVDEGLGEAVIAALGAEHAVRIPARTRSIPPTSRVRTWWPATLRASATSAARSSRRRGRLRSRGSERRARAPCAPPALMCLVLPCRLGLSIPRFGPGDRFAPAPAPARGRPGLPCPPGYGAPSTRSTPRRGC